MKIIKRSGMEVAFDVDKIRRAVERANVSVVEGERLTAEQISRICDTVSSQCNSVCRALNVEEIQDLVEDEIMREGACSVARNYITYRYKRALVRKANSTDKQILITISSFL